MRFASVRGGDVGHLSAVFVSGSKKPARGGGRLQTRWSAPPDGSKFIFWDVLKKFLGRS
jgi:hypothetical protein